MHHSFADDLQLQMSTSHCKITMLLHSMQSSINDTKAWAADNMLELNNNKMEYMFVNSKKQSVSNLGFTLNCHHL